MTKRRSPWLLMLLAASPCAAQHDDPAGQEPTARLLVEAFDAACRSGSKEAAAAAAANLGSLSAAELLPWMDDALQAAAIAPAAALPDCMHALATAAPWASAGQKALLRELADTAEARAALLPTRDTAPLRAMALAQMRILCRCDIDAQAPLAKLLGPIESDWEYQRAACCDVIAARGKAAAEAAPTLVAFLERGEHPMGHAKLRGEYYLMDDQPELAAARALLRVSDDRAHRTLALAALAACERDPARRHKAAVTLLAFDARELSRHVDLLIRASQDADLPTLREVTTALGMACPEAPAARAALVRLSQHDDPQVRRRAEHALARAAKRI
jgi:hypothetical protein